MSDVISSSYPLAALLIHATNQEVTKEKMQSVFETLGLEFSPKIASYFALSADKYASILSNVGGSAAAPVASGAAAPAGQGKEAAKAVVEESSSEGAIDFGF